MIKIKINAGHTESGNPRRGWIILVDEGAGGDLLDFVDEGYEGSGALLRKGYQDVPGNLELEVKPAVYREMRRLE